MYRDVNDYELLYLICEDNNDNYGVLINKYKPLAYKISYKYANMCKKYGLEFEDLLQISYISLIKAVNSFHDYRDNTFYTYLTKVVKNDIINEIRNNSTLGKEVLNKSISFDIPIGNNGATFIDTFIDPKSDFASLDLISKERYLITLKNSFPFDVSCAFELKYNGYEVKEIALLLNKSISTIRRYFAIIKKTILYM